jgi:hypothetical protein
VYLGAGPGLPRLEGGIELSMVFWLLGRAGGCPVKHFVYRGEMRLCVRFRAHRQYIMP